MTKDVAVQYEQVIKKAKFLNMLALPKQFIDVIKKERALQRQKQRATLGDESGISLFRNRSTVNTSSGGLGRRATMINKPTKSESLPGLEGTESRRRSQRNSSGSQKGRQPLLKKKTTLLLAEGSINKKDVE